MAHTYSTDLVDAQNASVLAKREGIGTADRFGGVVCLATAMFTFTGNETNGDTLQITPNLPVGAVVIPTLCFANNTDASLIYTWTFGIYNSGSKVADFAAVAISGSGLVRFNNLALVTPDMYRAASGDYVAAAFAKTLGTPAAGTKIQFTIAFRMPA